MCSIAELSNDEDFAGTRRESDDSPMDDSGAVERDDTGPTSAEHTGPLCTIAHQALMMI